MISFARCHPKRERGRVLNGTYFSWSSLSGTALAAGETRDYVRPSPAASAVPLSKVSAIGRALPTTPVSAGHAASFLADASGYGVEAPRRGFTLLEVVLALGLSSLLMAAIYSALQMHWSYSLTGQVEMERSQVARALFRRIEIDIRSVIFRSASLSSTDTNTDTSAAGSSSTTGASTGSTGTSGVGQGSNASTGSNGAGTGGTASTASTAAGTSGSSSDSTTSSTAPEDAYSTQKTGLFGDVNSLVLHVSLPSRLSSAANVSTSQSSGSVVPPSDLQSVAYFLAGSSSALAQQFSGALTSSANVPFGQQVGGLTRVQGDRMAMQAADESGDVSTVASNVKLLAPEVAAIQFEYFDGVSWTSTWDSGSTSSLPNAIRVTIDFHPPDTSRTGWFSRTVSESTNRFQQVIALPLAAPYVPEAS